MPLKSIHRGACDRCHSLNTTRNPSTHPKAKAPITNGR